MLKTRSTLCLSLKPSLQCGCILLFPKVNWLEKKAYLLLFYCVSACLDACMYSTCLQYLWSPEKGVGSLELGLQTVVSHHMDQGTESQSSAKTAGTLNCRALIASVSDCCFVLNDKNMQII